MPKTTIVLDIETVPDEGWTPRQGEHDFAPLPLHVPVSIVALQLTTHSQQASPHLEFYSYLATSGDEAAYLQGLGERLSASDRLVTWNGQKFDMPLLGLRAMKCGVDWSFWVQRRKRYGVGWSLYHHDLKDLLGDYRAHSITLDTTCTMLGLKGKGALDGSQVKKVWKEPGGPEKVHTYCHEDVWHTFEVYLWWIQTFYSEARPVVPDVRLAARAWAENCPVLARLF